MEDSKKASGELLELFRANMLDNQALWIKRRSNLKIYCVSKSKTGTPDNLLLWAHYAYKHMGAVIQHRCLKEQEMTDFGVFQVDYKKEMPIIADLNEYVKHFTGQKKLDFDNLAIKFARTKSDHWEYENEWRYIKYDITNSNAEFENVSIDPNKIEAIYFGCKMDEKELIEIKNLISGDFSHVKLFQAHQHTKFYKLEFLPIN
ncbi:DUF2971 domain-containing protein [Desulforegula conservatrix]|uniref:DUF2971 domain-containing protein n=1 Tax=Desulforegula conservatrix TaxID=153026 RepID=UPI0018DDE982|nr:DUF2971 domain-containing protein [Desulforegula conservatrix]